MMETERRQTPAAIELLLVVKERTVGANEAVHQLGFESIFRSFFFSF